MSRSYSSAGLEEMLRMKRNPRYTGIIENGDRVDISDLLFTQDRDYLIKPHNRRVKAKQLAGKVIVLHFVNLGTRYDYWMNDTLSLVSIYNELQPKGCMEVVFIAVTDDDDDATNQLFEYKYSVMPWPAIPSWDLESTKHVAKRFCGTSIFQARSRAASFVIDPAGLVLRCYATQIFRDYGAAAYPFSKERLAFLFSEDDAAKQHLSITNLLAFPERNYVISNNGKQVPVSDLEDKVVALYFYEEYPVDTLTPEIEMVYRELAKNAEKFEIVLIYVHDSRLFDNNTTEASFQKKFTTMPWLALPFKDPRCKKLDRIFHISDELFDDGPDPRLVIIGPYGNFCEPYGVDILSNYGVAAYPFSRESVAKLEVDKAKSLKLEMFWRDPNTLFTQKDGTTVQFSQLIGKRTILFFGESWFNDYEDFFWKLNAKYFKMKGTSDEFEVIHITSRMEQCSFTKDFPWLLTHPAFASESNECKLLLNTLDNGVAILAFDRDGTIACRTECPTFDDADFPFHAHSLEGDAVIELARGFRWWYSS